MARDYRTLNGEMAYVEGMEELKRQIQRIGKVPKRVISGAARAGMKNPLKEARASAPVNKRNLPSKGTLKKSIKSVMEKKTKRMKYKTVYDLQFNPQFASVFKGKKILRPGLYGAPEPREYGYYPLSQEFGFHTKHGYKKGRYFIAKAIEKHQRESLQKIVDTMNDGITQQINGS
jgi:hypothetical protein